MNKCFILRNNFNIPCIGIGTWKIIDRKIINGIIIESYKNDYKFIDTAAAYGNEISIGKALIDNSIDRNEILICDKVWNSHRSFDGVLQSFEICTKKLKTNYIDIFLIHWPASEKIYDNWKEINSDTWKGMEELYNQNKVKVIGVCNYGIKELEELRKTEKITPFVNQIEFHPGMYDKELLNYCKNRGIQLIASSPLGNGEILNNEQLIKIAKKKQKTVAQICLRWIIQKGVVAIPKTTKKVRLKENIDIFDFSLSDEEMDYIDNIKYCGGLNIKSEEELRIE